MKYVAVFYVVFFLIFGYQSSPQERDIREDMTVTNVEIPVRVFFKGKPVKNLKRFDFVLFENGRKQEINGFYEIRKVIDNQRIDLSSGRTEEYKPRYFVIVFRVTSVPDDLKKSVKYLINKTLRKSDQLLIFMNNKTIFLNNIADKDLIYDILIKKLKEEALKEKFRFEKYFQKVKHTLDQSRMLAALEGDESSGMMIADDVIIFLRNYLQIFREYKRRYLLPDIDNYYNFSKFLGKIQLEKWVISFYQFEKFPELKMSGKFKTELRDLIGIMQMSSSEQVSKSRIISKMLYSVDRELKVSEDFPAEEISKLFSKVNTTFHSLFFTSYSGINSQDLKFSDISTDLENTIRELTKATGGELIVSNKLETSLEKIVRKEDSYYILTYSPEENQKRGKIKVRTTNKAFRVHYDNNIRADYIDDYLKRKESEVTFVKLDKVLFFQKELQLKIVDIMQRKIEDAVKGRIKMRITIKRADKKIMYDKSRSLTTQKKEVEINIKMNWLEPGNYDLMVDVADILTGRSAFEYIKIKIK
ncbi:MAG: hypothetical protein KAR14_10320 [Candidatus Aminicenantes bacterium]|nr:hypothetical protein [Candidatus Aminicenantes bacterium]